MSVRWDTNTDTLSATTHMPSSPINHSVFGFGKLINSVGGTFRPFYSLYDSGFSGTTCQILRVDAGSNDLLILGGSNAAQVLASVSTGLWFAWALTCAGTGANQLIGYFKYLTDSGWTTASVTGINPTAANEYVGSVGSGNYCDQEGRYIRMWDAVLTPTELLAEANSATLVRTANIRRNLALATGATAGTDSSGNGFNMSGSGLVDGASEPTFGGRGMPFGPRGNTFNGGRCLQGILR